MALTDNSSISLNSINNSQENAEKLVLISPFFPFNNKLVYSFLSELQLDNVKIVYSSISADSIEGKYTLDDFIKVYNNYLDNRNEKIYLLGFGVFSLLFIRLILKHPDRIESLVLFEPDFTNQSMIKIFDSSKKILRKTRFSAKYYSKYKVQKKHLDRNKIKYIKRIYHSNIEYIKTHKALAEILKHEIDIHIFWNVMERETWPLAQIITEEYLFPHYKLDSDVYETLLYKDKKVIKSLEKILKK